MSEKSEIPKIEQLIKLVKGTLKEIPDPRPHIKTRKFSFSDIILSGLAVFGLKHPSLLSYEKEMDSTLSSNLNSLYGVLNPPSDTYLRERLDDLNPSHLRKSFKKIFSFLQRNKALEKFSFLSGHYLLALDGTGHFSSSSISCPDCCTKEHSNGKVSYYHQMLGGCLVHPDQKQVIPLCPEPIKKEDGSTKNDCERNASKRFLEHFRREHPHLKVIVIEDSLASNAPHIKEVLAHKMDFILGAKKGDHQYLFEFVENSSDLQYHELTDEKGIFHQFRFLNQAPLNKSNQELKVNFLEYRQTSAKGQETTFSWVTNIRIDTHNVFNLMRGARARWKIENETFNTLKNVSYNFEHNYGHGKKHLCTVFGLLTMLSFLIDQSQELICHLFRLIKEKKGAYQRVWEHFRFLFGYFRFDSWESLYRMIIKKIPP